MKQIKVIITLLSLFLYCNEAISQAGYFTLKGRQFYDENGDPFSPSVIPYQIMFAHNMVTLPNYNPTQPQLNNDYFVAPSYNHGSSDVFECDASTSISICMYNDFLKIQQMGFNTIRITGGILLRFNPGDFPGPPPDKFCSFTCERCVSPSCWHAADYIFINSYDPSVDHVLAKIFSAYDAVINLATTAPFNFKIIIEVGLGGGKNAVSQTDYPLLLAAFGDHFQSNHNIINYIIQSEPENSDDYYISKNEVCNRSTAWYNALKQHDPYHLISTAGDIVDVIYWDPAVIKADFYEIHPYPEIRQYEKDAVPSGYSTYDAAVNRFAGKMYWFKNYCPKPWTIGETGLRLLVTRILYTYLSMTATLQNNQIMRKQLILL